MSNENRSSQRKVIDINCDLGEGMPCDADIMPYITSCSIACGGHAGDDFSMRRTLELANKHQLKVGAHPSYPDQENFGRHSLQLEPHELTASLTAQIRSLQALLDEFEMSMHHVKVHGALYNDAAVDQHLAQLVVNVVKTNCPTAKLYVPYASQMMYAAQAENIALLYEVFADRNYNDDLSLVSRSQAHAIIHDSAESYAHVKRMLLDNQVLTVQNKLQTIQADTICVHSDTPGAVAIAAQMHVALKQDGFVIQ